MSANRVLLFFLVFCLALAGLALQRGEFVALALPILVYLAVAYLYAPQAPPSESEQSKLQPDGSSAVKSEVKDESPRLALQRSLSRVHAIPGQSLELALTLTNEGPAFDEVSFSGGLPPGVKLVDGPANALLPLPPGASAHLKQILQARRGEYEFPAASFEMRETLGLFAVQKSFSAAAHLVVEPVGERLRPFLLRPPQTRGFAGPVPARQGGRGTDFFAVREYQPGDSLRQINWKISSRAPRAFYTNIYEQQRIADVGIILDAREHADLHSTQGNLFEYAVQAATALSEPILKSGNRLGLLVYGPGMESVFPGYGKVQLRRILRALSRAGAGHNFALESLAHLPTRFFPSGSQIILISPLLPEDPPLVAHLVTLGYGVLVISPDPLIFEDPEAADAETSGGQGNLAWRLARSERRFILKRLERCGVRVIDWDVRQPLAPLLQRILKRG
jgi:uncharacterized protein (DUF58 family)